MRRAAKLVTVLSGAARTYMQRVLAVPGCIAYLPGDDLSGTTARDLRGHNWTYEGTPVLNQTPGPGDGKAWFLANASGYVSPDAAALTALNTAGVFNGDEITFGMWAQVTDAAQWSNASIYALMQIGVDANMRYTLYKDQANRIKFRAYTGAVGKEPTISPVTTLQPFFIAATLSKSANQSCLYFDGVLVGGAGTWAGTWAGALTAAWTEVGAIANGSRWPGRLGRAFIFNRALTPTEIWQLSRLTLEPEINLSGASLCPPNLYYPTAVSDGTLYAVHIPAPFCLGKSTDGGATWAQTTGLLPHEPVSVFVSKTGALIACASGWNYRSTDDGATWTHVFDCTNPPDTHFNSWGYAQAATGELFAGEYGSTTKCPYLWKSSDDGETWSRIDFFFDKTDKHIHQVKVDPYTQRLYVTIGDTPKKFYYSDDLGANWTEITTAPYINGYTGLSFSAAARFMGDDTGPGLAHIWKTTDDSAVSIVYTPEYPYNNQAVNVAVVEGTNELWATFYDENQILGAYSSVVASLDGGATWRTIIYCISGGGYKFNRIAVDYRGLIPAAATDVLVECAYPTPMLRIPRSLAT